MEINKINENFERINLDKSDIESAIRQFICSCHPRFAKDYRIITQSEAMTGEFNQDDLLNEFYAVKYNGTTHI